MGLDTVTQQPGSQSAAAENAMGANAITQQPAAAEDAIGGDAAAENAEGANAITQQPAAAAEDTIGGGAITQEPIREFVTRGSTRRKDPHPCDPAKMAPNCLHDYLVESYIDRQGRVCSTARLPALPRLYCLIPIVACRYSINFGLCVTNLMCSCFPPSKCGPTRTSAENTIGVLACILGGAPTSCCFGAFWAIPAHLAQTCDGPTSIHEINAEVDGCLPRICTERRQLCC